MEFSVNLNFIYRIPDDSSVKLNNSKTLMSFTEIKIDTNKKIYVLHI